jgi:hypothetical protein
MQEKASLFLTDEGIVVVIGNAQVGEKLPGYGFARASAAGG